MLKLTFCLAALYSISASAGLFGQRTVIRQRTVTRGPAFATQPNYGLRNGPVNKINGVEARFLPRPRYNFGPSTNYYGRNVNLGPSTNFGGQNINYGPATNHGGMNTNLGPTTNTGGINSNLHPHTTNLRR